MNDYSFTLDGDTVDDAVDAKSRFAVTVTGIKARALEDKHTITITNKEDGSSTRVEVSPLDYMGKAVSIDSQVELYRAFYNYYLKAKAYFG